MRPPRHHEKGSVVCFECGQSFWRYPDHALKCESCREADRAPQGEAVRLFTPAPAQLPGQEFFAVDVEPMPSRYRWTL
jgi:hypothetical protein